MPKNGKSFIFPCADGSVKLSGRDEVFRTSTLKKQDLLAREGGSTMMSFKESRTGLIQQINNERMTLKPETISGENLRIMFIAISFNQGSNFMCQTEGHSFHTTHLYRRCQAVECDIGCLAGESHRRLLERRWWLGAIRAMAWFHPVHTIDRKTSRRLPVVPVERRQNTPHTRIFHDFNMHISWLMD